VVSGQGFGLGLDGNDACDGRYKRGELKADGECRDRISSRWNWRGRAAFRDAEEEWILVTCGWSRRIGRS